MLGRTTGIVCLAATFAAIGLVSPARAQSMDMMSALMMSNRFMNPVAQYQPVNFTAEEASKSADNKAEARTLEQADRTAAKANTQTRQAEASLRPLKVAEPR